MSKWQTLNLDDLEENIDKALNKGRGKDDNSERRSSRASSRDTEEPEDEDREDDEESDDDAGEDSPEELEVDSDADPEDDPETEDKSEEVVDDGETEAKAREAQEGVRKELDRLRTELQRTSEALQAKDATELTLRKSVLESQGARLVTEKKELLSQKRKAKEDGDFDAETTLDEKIQRATLDSMAVANSLEEVEDLIKNPPKPKATVERAEIDTSTIPKAAQDFVNSNPWLGKADPEDMAIITNLSEKMIKRGEDPSKPEFYTKLGKVLEKTFEDSGYKIAYPKQTEKVKTEETKKLPAKKSGHPSRESASDNPSQFTRDKDKPGKIIAKVTKEDRESAKMFNIPLADYMQEKLKVVRAQQRGGGKAGTANIWTEIL